MTTAASSLSLASSPGRSVPKLSVGLPTTVATLVRLAFTGPFHWHDPQAPGANKPA